eukprot:jgi/Bigna1/138796/aug1.46_g13504
MVPASVTTLTGGRFQSPQNIEHSVTDIEHDETNSLLYLSVTAISTTNYRDDETGIATIMSWNMTSRTYTQLAGWETGGGGTTGTITDGIGSAARIIAPYGIVSDTTTQNMYFTDKGSIRKLQISNNEVTTLASTTTSLNFYNDGTLQTATFHLEQRGIVFHNNVLYALSQFHIRKINLTNDEVTTVAGPIDIVAGTRDGQGSNVLFDTAYGFDIQEFPVAYVSMKKYVRKVNLVSGEVTSIEVLQVVRSVDLSNNSPSIAIQRGSTIASSPSGTKDGTGSTASFYLMTGLAIHVDPSNLHRDAYEFSDNFNSNTAS